MTSPTQLTLRYLRDQGWLAQVVERWLPQQDAEAKGRREGLLQAADHLRERAARIERSLAALSEEVADQEFRDFEYLESAAILQSLAPPAEQFLGPLGKRVDLFGIIDILALDGQPGCLGVQACAYSGVSTHLREIKEGRVKLPAKRGEKARECPKLELAARWLAAGNRLWVIGWRKVGQRWQPRVVNVTEELLYAA
jgi:hypothetical protein